MKSSLDLSFFPMDRAAAQYEDLVREVGGKNLALALQRPDGVTFRMALKLLDAGRDDAATRRYLDRQIKMLLWQKGGSRLFVESPDSCWGEFLRQSWSDADGVSGERAFDAAFMGRKLFDEPFQVIVDEGLPDAMEPAVHLGGHLDGCRIGFDLGGSDRKCAALIDGEVVFSEEIPWDPYFQDDPEYHRRGIAESLHRAAQHLPRVDAIGGSAAGVYINNEVRAASLFRGLSEQAFNERIRYYFHELSKEWNVPVMIVNDGEVTALAASLSHGGGGILGVALGTSTAAGYVRPDGRLTCWLNELAFVPVDFREDAPVDEWSGDRGCGVQYFSQQAVARLGPLAGMPLEPEEKFPEYLERVQNALAAGNEPAMRIFDTIGLYLGHTLAWWQRFYAFDKLLLLGRVMSGPGGHRIQAGARKVLRSHYPLVSHILDFIEVSERDKRHGQAIAAASLTAVKQKS